MNINNTIITALINQQVIFNDFADKDLIGHLGRIVTIFFDPQSYYSIYTILITSGPKIHHLITAQQHTFTIPNFYIKE